jgi:mannose-6-phosphate isomerase-like protein (cupin superfamily)
MSIVSEAVSSPLRMPGATLATRLKVYDSPGPDGQIGGAPHMHLLCSEMYFVIAGSGAVEVIDADGFSRVELPLHSSFIFGPGILHRLVNPNRDLEVLMVIQNGGLVGRGDHIITFPAEVMNSDDAHTQAMQATTLEQAYRRRDQGVQGFLEIKAAFEQGPVAGRAALEAFYKAAAARTASRRAEWRDVITGEALSEAQETLHHSDRLAQGNVNYLLRSQQFFIEAAPYSSASFSGQLSRYFDPITLLPEGETQKTAL